MTGTPIKLMLDEHIWKGLTKALKQRGYDAVSIVDISRSAEDVPILELATAQGRCVLTFNVKHFAPMSTLWYEAGRDHAGIILSTEVAPGELVRRCTRLLQSISAEEIKNSARWLDEFK